VSAVTIVTCSPAELCTLIGEVIRNELASVLTASTAGAPVQRLTLDELARLEGASRATIRRLLDEGAPVHFLGDSPRFELAEWRAWLETRGRRPTKAKPPKAQRLAGVRLLSRRGGWPRRLQKGPVQPETVEALRCPL
jgi:hypothetical protein